MFRGLRLNASAESPPERTSGRLVRSSTSHLVAAILFHQQGRALLRLRDDRRDIPDAALGWQRSGYGEVQLYSAAPSWRGNDSTNSKLI